jgi:hypothetical protein
MINGILDMNEVVRDNWIAALTDGSYNQGFNSLRNERQDFCCFGVLCDLHHKATKSYGWDYTDGGYSYEGNRHCLPAVVQAWAGIAPGDIKMAINGDFTHLHSHNNLGVSFADIALSLKGE